MACPEAAGAICARMILVCGSYDVSLSLPWRALSRPEVITTVFPSVNCLLIFEAIAENYAEYRDYNSTTTQSDRGEQLHMLLDFLRLRVQYDRIAWHLRPVVLAHEILARAGRSEAAEMWCRAMAERTADVAGALTKRLQELHQKYGMRLPTVDDRLAERFIRPLAIDRVRAVLAASWARVAGRG